MSQLRDRSNTIVLFSLLAFACASPVEEDPDYTGMSEDDFSAMGNDQADEDYLRLVVVRDSFSSTYLMHWPKRKMPLEVSLPVPPEGLFENPNEVRLAVRRAILEWEDVVEPGVPSFSFVDDPGDADIPIVWAEEPDGDWYIAFCAYDVSVPSRFGVSHILVTGRWRDGHVASLRDIYSTIVHETGHALGLMGHSDSPEDVMWPWVNSRIGSGLSPSDENTLRKLYEHGNRRYIGRRGRR